MTPPKWTFHAIAATVGMAAVLASRVEAQPKTNPKTHPPVHPAVTPVVGLPKAPPIIFYPQANSFPGIPAALYNQPAFNPGPFYNPALNNPWMNQTRIIPTNPYAFVNNPFANNPFANNPFANPFVPASYSTPPIAVRQPGYLLYRGPDLQVNPVSGMVYRPLSGVARTADGSTFFHVPNTGLPTVTGAYSPGSGLYFDPRHNTFLNPSTGVISKPGVTNIFIPWIP